MDKGMDDALRKLGPLDELKEEIDKDVSVAGDVLDAAIGGIERAVGRASETVGILIDGLESLRALRSRIVTFVFYGVVEDGVVIVNAKNIESACAIAKIDSSKVAPKGKSPDMRLFPIEFVTVNIGEVHVHHSSDW